MINEILDLKEEMTGFLKGKFGIAPEESSLTMHTSRRWVDFLKEKHLNHTYGGVYFPRDKSAHISYNEYSKILLFHEYFGHGLYFEHTKVGQYMCELEKALEKEEYSLRSKKGQIMHRQDSELGRTINHMNKISIEQCEGFAMWMEWYLSNRTGNQETFAELSEKFGGPYDHLLNQFIKFYNKYGEHALMYTCGFPKHYDTNILEGILRKLFREDFNSIEFALVYGSRKPHSDIDIFMVSDKIPNSCEQWIDISSVSNQKFQELLSKMDLSITDPLFTGQFICGNKKYLEQAKATINEMPITKENIAYHLQHAEKAKQLALQNSEETAKYQTAMRWIRSYIANAKELEQKRKALTLANLATKHPEIFRKN